MKIELVKQTTKYTGDVYYFVNIDGSMQSGTFTSDYEKARQSFLTTQALVRQFPVTVCETIETCDTDESISE